MCVFFILYLSEIRDDPKHFHRGGVNLLSNGPTTDAVCGNCSFKCGYQETSGIIVLTDFRLTIDVPVDRFRICEKGKDVNDLHRHHYINRVITMGFNDYHRVKKFEPMLTADFSAQDFAKTSEIVCRSVSPCKKGENPLHKVIGIPKRRSKNEDKKDARIVNIFTENIIKGETGKYLTRSKYSAKYLRKSYCEDDNDACVEELLSETGCERVSRSKKIKKSSTVSSSATPSVDDVQLTVLVDSQSNLLAVSDCVIQSEKDVESTEKSSSTESACEMNSDEINENPSDSVEKDMPVIVSADNYVVDENIAATSFDSAFVLAPDAPQNQSLIPDLTPLPSFGSVWNTQIYDADIVSQSTVQEHISEGGNPTNICIGDEWVDLDISSIGNTPDLDFIIDQYVDDFNN